MGSAERITHARGPFGMSAREAMGTVGLLAVLWITTPNLKALADESKLGAVPRIQLDRGHPWRPPFGLDRVGGPLGVLVESPAGTPLAAGLTVVGFRDGQELARQEVVLQGQLTAARVQFDIWPSEVVLLAPAENGRREELTRQSVQVPTLEAEAIARSEVAIAPIDLARSWSQRIGCCWRTGKSPSWNWRQFPTRKICRPLVLSPGLSRLRKPHVVSSCPWCAVCPLGSGCPWSMMRRRTRCLCRSQPRRSIAIRCA